MEENGNDIAIIGMSGVFPEAADLQEFYRNLRSGRDSVSLPPADRLKYCGFDPAKEYKPAGHLDRIDLFDHLFFNISKKEAEYIEPGQRLALQLACTAIENAGYSLDELRGTNTGIFVASSSLFAHSYMQCISSEGKIDPTMHTGTLSSMVFGRIAYELQLTGPGVMIDTGCSSALVAINEAAEKLILDKLDFALVGAVNLKWRLHERSAAPGPLRTASSTGKSRAFDADADGIGVGEGGGMILLKRADKARADKNKIHALIKGIGLSQDGGRSNSITAPSPQAQTEAIVKAWNAAGIDPETISYVEAHGAGTKLGDVIEFQALTDAFRKFTERRSFCAVSTAKSNIGHLGNAAGIAGVIKAVLSLKNRVFFPSLHFDNPNPFIDFENSAAFVNTQCMEWQASEGRPRRCGVSSFGLSGTNAHLVLEEAPDSDVIAGDPGTPFLKISARSATALYSYVKDIAAFIDSSPLDLRDILYTLNKGRGDYAYRLAFDARDRADLLGQLSRVSFSRIRGLPPVRQKGEKAVVLFSTGTFDDSALQQLTRRYPAVRDAVARVTGGVPIASLGPHQRTFAIQYGSYHQLLAFGVSVEAFIGAGCGNVVMKVITGALSPAEAMAILCDHKRCGSSFKIDAFRERVQYLHTQHDPIFIEMGCGGILSTSLDTFRREMPGLELAHLAGDEAGSLEASFTALYNKGAAIDWLSYYKGRERAVVEAPTYPFDKIRCWFEKPYPQVVENADRWCFEPAWIPADVTPDDEVIRHRNFLIFCDADGLYKEVVYRFGQDNICILVHPGECFREITDNTFGIDVTSLRDYVTLHDRLSDRGIRLDGIVYLYGYMAPYELTPHNYSARIHEVFLPVYHIARAFNRQLQQPGFSLAGVTGNAYLVSGNEPAVLPVGAMLAGLFKALLTEYLTLRVAHLDMSFGEHTSAETAGFLWEEMHHSGLIRFSAIRAGRRHIMMLSPFAFDAAALQKEFTLKEDGVYLVTGGATGIGLQTAKLLAEQGRCTLLIIGRSAERPDSLDGLVTAGAHVEYYSADVGDFDRMRDVLSAIGDKYRKVDGLFHAAGIGSSGIAVKDRECRDIWDTLNAKVSGTIILDEWVSRLDIDLVLFFSSIGSLVPSKNCADYTAANAFEDAFAQSGRLNNRKYMAIDWADWKETGLVYRKNLQRSAEVRAVREEVVQGIYNHEGSAVIKCALLLGKPQLAVAKADISSFRINPFFILPDGHASGAGQTPRSAVAASSASGTPSALVPYSGQAPVRTRRIKSDVALTATEEKVMEAWYTVLRLDNIGLDDDFYEIGGHSLNIMQLLNLLNKEFGVEIGVEEMMYNSTVRQLAERIGTLSSGGYEPIEPLPPADHYAVSHAQKRFWLLNQLEGREAYHVPIAFRLTGTLDIDALQKAFDTLISRHESLRTSFRWVDGEPRQFIHELSAVGFTVRYIDLSDDGAGDGGKAGNEGEAGDGGEAGDEAARDIILKEAGMPFDLEQPCLIRALVLQTAADRHIVCITLHHIVADARSIAIIKKELLQCYHEYLKNRTPGMKPLSIHYKDFAAWQSRQLEGDRFASHRKYWLDRLRGYKSMVDIGNDLRPAGSSAAAGRLIFMLGADKTRQLRRMAERNGTTTFVVTLTLFNVLLSRLGKTDDITVATPVSGRSHADLEDQVGVFLNTLLLRTKVDAEDTFRALLQQVKYNTIKDLERQVYPYDLLVPELRPAADEQSPFHVGFTYSIKDQLDGSDETDMEIEEYATGFVMAKADLWMLTSESAGDITCSFVFRTCLYRQDSIEILRDRFLTLMNEALTGYDKKIKELDIRLAPELVLEESKLNIDFSF